MALATGPNDEEEAENKHGVSYAQKYKIQLQIIKTLFNNFVISEM